MKGKHGNEIFLRPKVEMNAALDDTGMPWILKGSNGHSNTLSYAFVCLSVSPSPHFVFIIGIPITVHFWWHCRTNFFHIFMPIQALLLSASFVFQIPKIFLVNFPSLFEVWKLVNHMGCRIDFEPVRNQSGLLGMILCLFIGLQDRRFHPKFRGWKMPTKCNCGRWLCNLHSFPFTEC